MKKLTLFFLFIIGKLAFSQEKLYYFYTKDSTLVGVKNDKGKVIIPSNFSGFKIYNTEKPINEPTIELWGTPSLKNRKYKKDNPRIEDGEVYDREGKFLYYPQWFDNGPDYWEENTRRYVKNDKIGFVNWFGKKITPAQWDFATPFNYGYAVVYTGGWKRNYIDDEHWNIAPTSKKSTYYLINKKGKKVSPLKKSNNPKDFFYEGKYYPYPFIYNDFEQKLINQINELKILKELQYDKEQTKHYEIIGYPNAYLPYYQLKAFYGKEKNSDSDYIWVNIKGDIFYRNYAEEFIPLKQYTKEILEQIIEDQKEGYKTDSYPIKAKKILKELDQYLFKIKM